MTRPDVAGVRAAALAIRNTLEPEGLDPEKAALAAIDAYFAALAPGDAGERANKIIEIQRHALDRYMPCPDHRDKVPPGECSVCYGERTALAARREGGT